MKNVLVFTPNTLNRRKSGFLEGFREEFSDCEAFYVTNSNPVKENRQVIGYVSGDSSKPKTRDFKGVFIDNATSTISVHNQGLSSSNLVRIVYDFEAFRSCELNSESQYGAHFKLLSERLRMKRKSVENGRSSIVLKAANFALRIIILILAFLNKTKPIWGYSATISHFHDNLVNYKWFFQEIIKEKRINPRSGNFILSMLVDLTLGIFFLKLCLENRENIVKLIEEVRENIIHDFRDLLMYLMGSPIGLKLNYAFNKSLGTFFFYHISLWRIFLMTTQPFLKVYFKFLVLPGAFGFSYQIAMLSDLISVATFHVYCIYVYAARLIYLQLKGLLSLWRLFIGRKYNPLRLRVDSYQYSQHQLFIGTLGFTVLLFLLPTTTLYYTVFVIFRLAVMIVGEILIRVRYWLHCLPFYVLILWLLKSSYMTGPVCLKYKKTKDNVATFEAYLKTLPLQTSIVKYAPYTVKPGTNLSWGKVFTGVLL